MTQVTVKAARRQRESAPKSKPPVRVFRRGQLTEIIPPVEGLDKEFLTVVHEAHASQAHGFEILRKLDPLVWRLSESPEFSARQRIHADSRGAGGRMSWTLCARRGTRSS